MNFKIPDNEAINASMNPKLEELLGMTAGELTAMRGSRGKNRKINT